jgi:hypothetical protein
MKRKITDRVRSLGYLVEAMGNDKYKVFIDMGTHYQYFGTFSKNGLKEEFNV